MRTDAEVQWVPVREVGDVRMGKQLSPASKVAAGQRPYLRVANVLQGRIDYTDVKTMGFSEAERETYGLKPGDILLNEGQSLELVGRSAIYDGAAGEFFFQNTLVRFRPSNLVLSAYAQVIFERWLANGVFASIAKQTTSIAHLGGERFASLSFPLLPLSEQSRIVEVVDAISAQERAIEASVAKLGAMKSGALDGLLDEFTWSFNLADATDGVIRNGFSPVESETWTGVQMLGLGCLTPAGFKPVQLKNAPPSVTADHVAVVRDGDLLMSRANTRELVGLVGIYRHVGSPCIYPDLMMRIRPSRACSTDFLAAVLMSARVRGYVRSMAQGTSDSMVKISANSVRGIPVPLPDLEDQTRILAALASLSRQVDVESEELAKLRKLKLGLFVDLLAGGVGGAMRQG
ncbi:restriction endonuclease subunit S [Streptomyces viridifaciens]|nr:restriction endonuclease subunit S [Streptomyces viridifaciens]UKZ07217.1 restriction endonuclease subunit S [Streptomyces viridifaciens]